MPNTIAQKLKIKDGSHLLLRSAPDNFLQQLAPLPANIKASATLKKYDQVHWFVTNKKQLEEEVGKIVGLLQGENICWVYYPKGSSKIQTDLTRDKGWDALLKHKEMHWISLISFDETWSAFGFRLKTAADKKKDVLPKVREIFNYVDTATKTVKLPVEFENALAQNEPAANYFKQLSFSNKKEYVEWIITAKREETRLERINGSIERLQKRWKNPRNM